MTTTSPVRVSSLRDHMRADHAELEILFERLVATFQAGDRDQAAQMFREFERRLETHLALEDDHLVPALAATDRGEAEAIAADHRRLRARVTELGVGVDLHLTRATAVADLVDELRNHASREDAVLYRWADEALDEPTRHTLLERMRAWAA